MRFCLISARTALGSSGSVDRWAHLASACRNANAGLKLQAAVGIPQALQGITVRNAAGITWSRAQQFPSSCRTPSISPASSPGMGAGCHTSLPAVLAQGSSKIEHRGRAKEITTIHHFNFVPSVSSLFPFRAPTSTALETWGRLNLHHTASLRLQQTVLVDPQRCGGERTWAAAAEPTQGYLLDSFLLGEEMDPGNSKTKPDDCTGAGTTDKKKMREKKRHWSLILTCISLTAAPLPNTCSGTHMKGLPRPGEALWCPAAHFHRELK